MIDRTELRALYSAACHGAGAPVRTLARKTLELMLFRNGVAMRDAFADNGLSIADYVAAKRMTAD